tara:strand:+ start:933 stop:1484 length:552 start_codon:yes stop_codon:yes gene_type:complete
MKLFKICIFLFISFNTSLKANLNDDLQKVFNEGGKLIFIRHGYAPGVGDPVNFNIFNCATQRNLDNTGIQQSKDIKEFFLKSNINIDKVLSSEWCRCKDSAEYAFDKYETKSFLNSFFSKKFSHNKSNQIKELKEYVENWNSKKNLVLITHFVVISELLDVSASSGEVIITNKDFEVLIRVND